MLVVFCDNRTTLKGNGVKSALDSCSTNLATVCHSFLQKHGAGLNVQQHTE